MRNSRLIGGKPKIGIRPIIDGRRGGIRESLEDMTMAMAHKVAELYSSVLRHSDGTSVECVIADTTIGGVAEAAMAAEKFRNSGVGVVLSVTPCWCYGFETIDMDGEMPKAIWGFNGTERPLCPCRYSCGYNEGEILSFNRQCIHGHCRLYSQS